MNKQLQLVSFEQAKRLKADGFDYKCTICYAVNPCTNDIELCSRGIAITHKNDIVCDAPTVALALKWFRDEKGIMNAVTLATWSSTRDGSVKTVYHPSIKSNPLGCEYNTYELAESALLDELLTLIEKEK